MGLAFTNHEGLSPLFYFLTAMKFQEFTLIISIITMMLLTSLGGQKPLTSDYSTINWEYTRP